MSLELKVEKHLRKKVGRDFLDLIILSKLGNGEPTSGYDFIGLIHEKYGVIISSGTIYSKLYSLEREGFITGCFNERKRVYKITDLGKKFANAAQETVQHIIETI